MAPGKQEIECVGDGVGVERGETIEDGVSYWPWLLSEGGRPGFLAHLFTKLSIGRSLFGPEKLAGFSGALMFSSHLWRNGP